MRTILPSIIVVVLFFAIIRINSDNPMDVSGNEVALNWTQRAIGGLIAASAAFALLLRGAAILLADGIYVARSCREGQIDALRGAY